MIVVAVQGVNYLVGRGRGCVGWPGHLQVCFVMCVADVYVLFLLGSVLPLDPVPA